MIEWAAAARRGYNLALVPPPAEIERQYSCFRAASSHEPIRAIGSVPGRRLVRGPLGHLAERCPKCQFLTGFDRIAHEMVKLPLRLAII